jgi:hypothetical protein
LALQRPASSRIPTIITKNLTSTFFALLVLLSIAFACKSYTEGKPAAEKAITEFHSLLDGGRFDEIYDGADKALKDSASREQMLKILNAVHVKLGKVKSTAEQSWHIGNFNLTTTVTIVDETTFESGKGIETFTYIIDGNQARLAGYYINSTELITN